MTLLFSPFFRERRWLWIRIEKWRIRHARRLEGVLIGAVIGLVLLGLMGGFQWPTVLVIISSLVMISIVRRVFPEDQ
jgi:hypothetical protein